MKGTFRAKAVVGQDSEGKPISGLRTSKTKGTPEFFVQFKIVDEGSYFGKTVPWDGWLTDSTEARTLEALLLMGLENDDLANPIGIDKNVVSIVVEEEEYEAEIEKTDDQTGNVYIVKEKRKTSRVQWVNDPARSASVHKPMESTDASAFAQRMQGAVMAARARRSGGQAAPQGDGTDFKFGANLPPGQPAQTPPAQTPPAGSPQPNPVSPEAQQASPKAGF